jgi:hypothetical protein
MDSVMSSGESRLTPNHKIQGSHAAGVVQPASSESKQVPNTRTASQAESLLAAEKRTLEMIVLAMKLPCVAVLFGFARSFTTAR